MVIFCSGSLEAKVSHMISQEKHLLVSFKKRQKIRTSTLKEVARI